MKENNFKSYTHEDIMGMDTRFRAAFINSLTGFKSLALIGTKNKSLMSNLAVFNSLVHLGANPPLVGFISRPDSAERHTLSNIEETGFYTINQVNETIFKQAHQCSARYPKEISEFKATGLSEEYLDDFFAPYVKESMVKIALNFKERIDIKLNQTSLIIGEIKHVYFPKNCIFSDGFFDLEKAETIASSGLDSYHTTKRIARLSYAKPSQSVQIINSDYLE